ncbi:hypothetical protein FB45DRAFT_929801 [Roridomyces roridus]|uniref:Uncharacterized protein n=1 Tax=Roridomyces roridus TaxID=1738132 RepID=A0AAD7FHH0_9AGAR|nr:hypothetical protein FB45DRAFT_929801 [Roridomyces roridus]
MPSFVAARLPRIIHLLAAIGSCIRYGWQSLLRILLRCNRALRTNRIPEANFDRVPPCSTQPITNVIRRLSNDAGTSPQTRALAPSQDQDDGGPSHAGHSLSSSHPAFFCTAPELLPRYTIRPKITKTGGIPPLAPNTRSFTQTAVANWAVHVSPEGAPYYSHDSGRFKVFTEAALYEQITFRAVMVFLRQFQVFCATHAIERDPQVEMVVDFVQGREGNPATCGYYLADHGRRIIFWYDTFKPENLPRCHDVYGAYSSQHIRLELEAQYWFHCALFPSALSVTHHLLYELRDVVTFTVCDIITAVEAPVTLYNTDMLGILTVIDGLREELNAGLVIGPGATFIIARIMWRSASHKFLQFYGEPCARVQVDTSVFEDASSKRSIFFRLTAPLMFNASWAHVQSLENIYVDELLNKAHWIAFVEKLTSEWQELTLYATVLLNADIAFLSVPTIQHGESTSVGQIASYVSVIGSLGSIILGLGLMRQYRMHREGKSIVEAATFLGRRFHSTFGFESLAQLYSLPFVLLMWGTITFLVAFLGMCFQSSDNLARSIVAATTFLAAAVGMRCYYSRNTSFTDWVMSLELPPISWWWNREPKDGPAV